MHKLLGWLVIVAIPLVVFEFGAYVFVRERDGWFSHRDAVLARLAAEGGDYARFLEEAYHPVYGWDQPAGQARSGKDCLGRPIQITRNPDRSRLMPAVAGGPEVLLVGDSFTAGARSAMWRLSPGASRKRSPGLCATMASAASGRCRRC
jgi:hypothetical protein